MARRLFVLVDRRGNPVQAAGPAPFDGETAEEALREARATVSDFRPQWEVVPYARRHRNQLLIIAERLGFAPDLGRCRRRRRRRAP